MSRVPSVVRAKILPVLGLALVATGLQVTASSPAVANPEGTDLVINEVSGGNGTGTAATDEYVELYNPTSETIAFQGRIQYKSATGSTYSASVTASIVVQPHGYWLAAGANYSGTATPDVKYSFDMSASTTAGGHIALVTATSDPVFIDRVGWGTANQPETQAAPAHPPAGGSLRRTNARDTDNNSVDFIQAASRSPRSSTSSATTMTDPGARSFAVDAPISPFSVTASGGRAPYTYAVSAGALPDGLSLASTTGEISGTPTVARPAADVTVRATDANGDPAFRTFSVEVIGAAADPVIVQGPGNRVLSPGAPISPLTFEVSGGVPPYTFAITDGTLPDGLELDGDTGEISGTPDGGTPREDITVTVTDSEGETGTDTFWLEVVTGYLTTAVPTIDDTEPAVGDVLTADAGDWGPAPVQLSYLWMADGVEVDGVTGATLTVPADLVGAAIVVRVTGSRSGYYTQAVDSLATADVVARTVRFTTTPSVTGTLTVGETLNADPGVTDPAAADVAYQWRRDDVPIDGATAASYALVAADLGADISVTVTATHAGYADASETSSARGPVAAATFATGPSVVVSGTPVVDGTLVAEAGTTTPAAESFDYAWSVGGATVGTNSDRLVLTPAMVGETVTVRVTAKRAGYDDASADADPTAAVSRATFATGPTASISGTPVVGGTLTAGTGTTSPAADSFTYAWTVGDDDAGTGSSLALTPAMVGKTVRLLVTAKRDGYIDALDGSDPTAAVARATFATGPTASISGTPVVGGTLTASTGTTSPAADSFAYAWTVGGDAAGTGSTLALTPAMVDKTVRVTVTAERDGYDDASDVSDPTAAIARATFTTGPTASISGTPVVGGTLTASTGTTSPAADSFAYAWSVGGDTAGTGSTLALTPAMVGKTVTVTVTAKRDGYTDASDDSDPTAAVARAAFVTGPTASISGTPVVGGTLTAVTGTTSPVADSFTYAWTVGGDTAGTGSTLALTPAMVGKTVTVTVTAKRDGYTDASDDSDPTAAVARAAFVTGPTASISGTPVVGGTLTAVTGTTSPVADSFTYAWTVGGDTAGTGSTLALTPAMVGKTVTVTVTAKRDGYTDASDHSDPTAAVARATFTTAPTASITGTPVVGGTLTAVTGTPVPVAEAFTYAWSVGGDAAGTATSLALTPAMVGQTVTVTITAKRDGYTDASDVSDPTAAVARATFTTGPTASISGTPVVGGTLTAATGTTVPAAESFGYLWMVGDTPIPDSTDTLTLTPEMAGQTVTLMVTGKRDGFHDVLDASEPTDPVARATFATAPVATVSGTARVGQVLTATAGAPVPTPDTITFRWYADDVAIVGADGPQLPLSSTYVGRRIGVEVVAARAGYVDATSRSAATDPVAAGSAPRLTLGVRASRTAGSPTTVRIGTKVTIRWAATSESDVALSAGGSLGKLLAKRYRGAPIPASGQLTVRVTRPGRHSYRLLATNVAGTTTATDALTALRGPKRLQVEAPATTRPGATIAVRVRGLAGSERYTLTVAGTTTNGAAGEASNGRAARNGAVVRRVEVPAGTTRLRITVVGSARDRTGTAVVRVR